MADSWGPRLGVAAGVGVFAALLIWGPLAGSSFVRQKSAAPTPAHRAEAVRIEPAEPVELRIPSIKVVAKVVPVRLGTNRTLQPPRKPKLLGWWSASARPGSATGAIVIAGHTVHTGGGALDRLDRARTGATIEVRTKAGLIRYRLSGLEVYRKAGLAKKAQQLFGRQGDSRLVIVTCDDWNGRVYLSNVVAVAEPVSVRPARAHAMSGSGRPADRR